MKKKKGGIKGFMISVFALVAAVVFMPTTILLFFGMLPTIVAGAIDRTGKGTMALTVGAMNMAGCTPFALDLWTSRNTIDRSLEIISDPRTIIVIYCAAGIGYLLDWALSGIVKTILVQRSSQRLKDIQKRKERLIARWGKEVTGDIPMDSMGFPLVSPSEDMDKN